MPQEFRLPFVPTAEQLPASESTAENKCVGGQRGGGKTAWLGGKIVNSAYANPFCDFVALRADRSDFIKTTLKQIEKFLPGVERTDWVHNKTDSFIKVRSCLRQYWSTIWYVEGKDPNSFKGGNIAGVYGDEADEIPYATIAHLSGSLRQGYPEDIWHRISPITGQPFGQFPPYEVAMATNPSPSWIMDRFPVYPEEHVAYAEAIAADDYFRAFPSPVTDGKLIDADYAYFPFKAAGNTHNPPGYVERLRRMYAGDPVLLARMVDGLWDATMEGLVYRLTRAHRWYSADPSARLWQPDVPVVLGIDPSNGAGFYAVMVLQFVGNRVFVVDEWAREAGMDEEFVAWFRLQPYAGDCIDAVVDNALPVTVRRLRELGIPARPCGRKDVIGQINAVRAAMEVDETTGEAGLVIDEARCPRLRDEMSRRIYRKPNIAGDPVSPQPPRGWDDCCKALEYPIVERMPTRAGGLSYRKPATQARHFRGRQPRPFHPLMTGKEPVFAGSKPPDPTVPVAGPQYRAPELARSPFSRRS